MSEKRWNDHEIVEAVMVGGNSRELALYHVFFRLGWKEKVIQYVLKNSGNTQDGEDLAQSTLIYLDRNLREGKFQFNGKLQVYFMAIARNQWLKRLEKRIPTDEINPEHYKEIGEDVEVEYIREEKRKHFDKALEKIGERCKKILLLQKLEYSLKEIADQVGLSSTKMAKKEAYRCRNRFRKFLDENPNWRGLIR